MNFCNYPRIYLDFLHFVYDHYIEFDLSGNLTNLPCFAPSLVLLKAFQFSKLKNKSFHKMVGVGGRDLTP